MTRLITLTVNNKAINLDYYVREFVYHMLTGIVGSLRDTGDIKELTLTVDDDARVSITLNGEDVSLKEFPMLIIKSTLDGMLYHLKGVDGPVQSLVATIKQ